MLYQHAGEMIRNFIKDIKDLTLKAINDELAKIEPLPKSEIKSKRQLRGCALEENKPAAGGKAGAGGGANAAAKALDEALGPRENISKAIAKVMGVMNDKDPKLRTKGAGQIEAVFKSANMRVLPDGLGDFAG
jgi:hypothetical protein